MKKEEKENEGSNKNGTNNTLRKENDMNEIIKMRTSKHNVDG